MICITDKTKCCGCSACASACPKACIEMKVDSEGFLYPVVSESDCMDCGKCNNVCPIEHLNEEKVFQQKAYLVQHKDEIIRTDSTSGGAFTAIATYILTRGGVVFGAAYKHDFTVHHTYVEDVKSLSILRNSKYVESEIGKSYINAKFFLNQGRWVCFSGTPCQIEGLIAFLGKNYDKLVLVDIVCHGIPSPLIWKKYLEYQRVHSYPQYNIRFRDKYYGYKYSTMSVLDNGRTIYHAGAEADPMLRAFFDDMIDRPACYSCNFKKRYRRSDFTLWDCFSVYDFNKNLDDDKGTSRVLVHSKKGNKIFDEIKTMINVYEVDPEKIVYGVKEMFSSVCPNNKRDVFFADALKLSGKELFLKYYPISKKIKIKTAFRLLLLNSGLYAIAKKYLNKLNRR